MNAVLEHSGVICLRAKPSKRKRNNFLTLKIHLEKSVILFFNKGKDKEEAEQYSPPGIVVFFLFFFCETLEPWSPTPRQWTGTGPWVIQSLHYTHL